MSVPQRLLRWRRVGFDRLLAQIEASPRRLNDADRPQSNPCRSFVQQLSLPRTGLAASFIRGQKVDWRFTTHCGHSAAVPQSDSLWAGSGLSASGLAINLSSRSKALQRKVGQVVHLIKS